eukprot:Polyplicarium_translucidae@DN3378_c1_g3_i2.p1
MQVVPSWSVWFSKFQGLFSLPTHVFPQRQTCPDMWPKFLRFVAKGKIEKAYDLLKRNSALPELCRIRPRDVISQSSNTGTRLHLDGITQCLRMGVKEGRLTVDDIRPFCRQAEFILFAALCKASDLECAMEQLPRTTALEREVLAAAKIAVGDFSFDPKGDRLLSENTPKSATATVPARCFALNEAAVTRSVVKSSEAITTGKFLTGRCYATRHLPVDPRRPIRAGRVSKSTGSGHTRS